MVFSFYYTEKIALIVLDKNPLMEEIHTFCEDYEVDSVDAVIQGDYIIPGINGLEVNARESFYGMQELNVFNEYYLVYDQVTPEVSIEDHKDKIIKQGNAKLKQVSLILSSEKTDAFDSLENTLNLNKENKHICVLDDGNYEVCLKNKNYLVEPTLKLSATNYIDVKNHLNSGCIILICDNAKLEDVKLLLKEIKYKGYDVVYLSELISEENIYFSSFFWYT